MIKDVRGKKQAFLRYRVLSDSAYQFGEDTRNDSSHHEVVTKKSRENNLNPFRFSWSYAE